MHFGDPRTIDSSYILAGSPMFSIPGGVSQVDSFWSTCNPAAPGGYGPHQALTKAANLVPTTTPPPVATEAKPEPSAILQLTAETGALSTANRASSGQDPQDPSNLAGTSSQDPGAPSSPGAATGGDPGSTTGKQAGDSGSGDAPGAKGNLPDAQNPGTSHIPSVGSGGNSGNSARQTTGDTVPGAPVGKASGSDPQDPSTFDTSSVEHSGNSSVTPQVNGGNVGSGSPEGSKANGTDPQDPGVPNAPGSASKRGPGPEKDGNGGSEIGASLQEAPGGGLELGHINDRTWSSDHTLGSGFLRRLWFRPCGWHLSLLGCSQVLLRVKLILAARLNRMYLMVV